MKRHPIILVETIIAAVIACLTMAICCGALLYVIKQSKYEEHKLLKEGMTWQRISHLRTILSNIQQKKGCDPFFLEATPSGHRLIFTLDNGDHVDPQLAHEVLAMMYVDPSQGLVLVTRAHPNRESMKQQNEQISIIWPDVERVHWKFALKPQDKENKPGIDTSATWQTQWPKEWGGYPAAIQITIEEKNNSKPYVITGIVFHNLDEIALV